MRKIRDVLRLKYEVGLSHELIAAAIGMSKGAVTNAVRRAVLQGLGWPLPAELDDGRLEAMLYRQAAPCSRYVQPDYARMHEELKRKGVTLQLLWEEYEAAHDEHAYRYSQFCAHCHEFRGTLARSMRQVHRAGEKVFIDYSGDTRAVIDPKSGEVLTAEIFVATLGGSKYAYAEATWTQTLSDRIGSNIRMLEFFGAVPSLWSTSAGTPPKNRKASRRHESSVTLSSRAVNRMNVARLKPSVATNALSGKRPRRIVVKSACICSPNQKRAVIGRTSPTPRKSEEFSRLSFRIIGVWDSQCSDRGSSMPCLVNYYSVQSQLAWKQGRYGMSALLYGGAFVDAAIGVLTLGQGSLATNGIRSGSRLIGAGGGWAAIAERPGGAVAQMTGTSCGAACGEMLSGISQATLIKAAGSPTDVVTLARALGAKWRGGYVGPDQLEKLLGLGQPFAAEFYEAGRLGHLVVVDGVNDVGQLLIRDSWGGVLTE